MDSFAALGFSICESSLPIGKALSGVKRSESAVLISINAFYEWDHNRPKGKRNRYRIKSHEAAMTLGGIFEISDDGEMFLSMCTTDPSEK